MSKRRSKEAKMENVEEMDTDQPSSSSSLNIPVKSKKELFEELNTLYWEYYDVFGEKFVPREREAKLEHDYLSVEKEKIKRKRAITELRPVNNACAGCGSRDANMQFDRKNVCHPCNINATEAECPCTGVPQLLNECVPMWSPKYIYQSDCQRCKKIALGKLNKSTNKDKEECVREGGYGRFQDLSNVNIPSLFPQKPEMGSLIVRAMKFTEKSKRVLANAVVKFRLDDALITTLNGFQIRVHDELRRIKVAPNINLGFRPVAIEDKMPLHFGLSVTNNWSSVPAREINMYNFADVLSNVKLNSQEGQGIQTEMIISQIKLKPEHEYSSLASLVSHLANRGAKLIWEKPEAKGTPLVFVEPDKKDGKKVIQKNRKGLIYMHAIQADDYILVSIGSTTGNKPRYHPTYSKTALANYKKGKSASKEFNCVLYYVAVDDEDDLFMYEGILQNNFLLAQLKGLSLKNFVPPFTDNLHQFNQNNWKDLKIDKMPDKPIKILNESIIMRNYSQVQFDKMVNFFKVLLKVEFDIEYDWDKDPLKFVLPK